MDVALWVTPVPYRGHQGPEGPSPKEAGLREGIGYRVLAMHDDGRMDSEAYFSVVNEEGEVWFISNRHLRVLQAEDINGTPVLLQAQFIDSQ